MEGKGRRGKGREGEGGEGREGEGRRGEGRGGEINNLHGCGGLLGSNQFEAILLNLLEEIPVINSRVWVPPQGHNLPQKYTITPMRRKTENKKRNGQVAEANS